MRHVKLAYLALAAGALLPLHADAQGLPGLRGTDHVAITVPNLTEAVSFLVDVVGCEAFYVMGPFKSDDNWMKVHLDVDPRAEIPRMQLVRCGYGSNLEVIEYTAPDQKTNVPRNSDIGGHHIAFYVDDIDAAVARLKAAGVRMLGEPTTNTAGPNAGTTWGYFLAPWGLYLEIVSYNEGNAYEKDYDKRLWDPRQPGM
ncbi:MAG TPA: VOC family protein [Alphaproteobacteria bacterium]